MENLKMSSVKLALLYYVDSPLSKMSQACQDFVFNSTHAPKHRDCIVILGFVHVKRKSQVSTV